MLGKLFQTILNFLSQITTGRRQAQQSESSQPSHDISDSSRYIERRMEKMHRFEEGVRDKPYKDSLGYWTIGIGHLMDERIGGFLPSYARRELDSYGFITDETISHLYQEDMKAIKADLDRALPWAAELDDVRYMCLLDMCFQLGIGSAEKGTGLLGFKNTLRFIQNGDYEQAAKNMLLSKWARQTPNRAKRRANEMRTGEPYPY